MLYGRLEVCKLPRPRHRTLRRIPIGRLCHTKYRESESDVEFRARWLDLGQMEQRLEKSRLAREDNYGPSDATDRMRAWVRENRSDAAKHWNLLTDLRREHLSYGG